MLELVLWIRDARGNDESKSEACQEPMSTEPLTPANRLIPSVQCRFPKLKSMLGGLMEAIIACIIVGSAYDSEGSLVKSGVGCV